MAFPTTPVDGQIHISTSGLKYVSSGATLGKSNVSATVAPVATDDNTAGYGVGSLWVNLTDQSYYNCISSTAASAVWIKSGFKPAYAISSLPLLTTVPAVSTAITWPTPVLIDLTHAAGVFTVATAGIYDISYIANFEATNKLKGYYTSISVNGVIDPIQGTTFTDQNIAGTRWPQVITLHKTLSLVASNTFSINHFTDNVGSTVSGNLTIKRID